MKIKNLTYLLFVISNLLILFNPGIFWDDWNLYNIAKESIYSQYNNGGLGYFGYLQVFLQNFYNPPFLYHTLTFGLQLISIYFLFEIVKRLTFINHKFFEGNYLVLIYAVLPLNDAKITMICFPYTLSLTLFILATFFLVKYKYEKNSAFRFLSLFLYFISFSTVSLVFFYLIPFLFIIFLEEIQILIKNGTKNITELFNIVVKKIVKFLDFLFLPILFWIIKTSFFSPSNNYVGYNEIKLESFVEIPYRLIRSIYSFFITLYPLLKELFQNLEFILLFIILSGFIFLRLGRLDLNFKSTKTKFLTGLLVCFIGIFPYLLVEKYPSFNGYNSRHQLLMGFGISLLVVNLIFYISSKRIRNLTLALCIGLFVILNMTIQFNYFKGFMKQVVLNNYLESQNLSRDFSQTILYKDNTSNFTHKGNPFTFYELSGILKLSHPKENIMLIQNRHFISYNQSGLFKKLTPYFYSYNLSNYNLVNPGLELEISYSKESLPSFPLFVYYGDYLSGNKEKWMKYFEFNLKVL
jgi:hypothetical protein